MPSNEVMPSNVDTSPHGANNGYHGEYRLKCDVCAEDIRAFVMGAKVCRACASFYKRAVLENLKYKCVSGDYTCDTEGGKSQRVKCKACRFYKCQRANIEVNLSGTPKALNGPPKALPCSPEIPLSPLFSSFVKAYDDICAAQWQMVKEQHKEINFTESTFVTPRKRYIYDAECSLLKPALAFFEECCEPFNRLSRNDKLTLTGMIFVEFRTFHQAFLTCHYCPDLDDPKVVFAPGYWADPFNIDYDWWFEGYIDKGSINEYWNVVLPFNREFIDIIRKIKILKIDKVDTIALMFMVFFKHAEYADQFSSEMSKFKETVMSEWMTYLDRRFGKDTPNQLANIMILYKRFDEIAIECANTATHIKVLRNSGVNVVNCDISHLVDALKIGCDFE